MPAPPADLADRMAQAVRDQDFELAAQLRDELAAIAAAGLDADDTRLRRQTPGKMGLGTDQAIYRPPDGWTPPRKPDPMTARTKRRGGR